MKAEKKDWLALFVFFVVTFGLALFCYLLDRSVTDRASKLLPVLQLLKGFSPAIGCIAARAAFREDFKSVGLLPTFTGRFRGYGLAVLLPVVMGVIAALVCAAMVGTSLSFKLYDGALDYAANMLQASGAVYTGCILLLGEELGFRGFLYEKLEKMCGLFGSLIVGGVLWGLWYAPEVLDGQYFGKSGAGMPYLGIPLMCIGCIFLGSMLVLVYKMTGSVWAAVLCRAVTEYLARPLQTTFLSSAHLTDKVMAVGISMLLIAAVPVAAFSVWRMRKLREGNK